jgi:hypothetical protein
VAADAAAKLEYEYEVSANAKANLGGWDVADRLGGAF